MNADEIVNRRTDMSQYLFHWTDKSHFLEIIRSGFLIATSAPRDVPNGVFPTIRGNRSAVCFSEMPIGNYLQSTVIDSSRYKRWGIAIPKQILYAYGARPVFYSDERFYDHLYKIKPKTEGDRYRFLYSRYSAIETPDWTHEREWRVPPNPEFNEKIGLTSDIFEHSVNGEMRKLNGKRLIPVHFPYLHKGNLCDQLTGDPQYVIFVETDEDVESAKFPLAPALVKVFAKRYASISQYRDKYLESLKRARVISFDEVKNARDRMDFWRVEDFIDPPKYPQSKLSILWNKATVQTRRQVLGCIDAPEKGYEYYQWQDLLRLKTNAIITQSLPSIHKQIERSEQAVRLLENDMLEWVGGFLGVDLID